MGDSSLKIGFSAADEGDLFEFHLDSLYVNISNRILPAKCLTMPCRHRSVKGVTVSRVQFGSSAKNLLIFIASLGNFTLTCSLIDLQEEKKRKNHDYDDANDDGSLSLRKSEPHAFVFI